MNKHDIGKLTQGMRVNVEGKIGTVVSVHEPQWVDHKTRTFQHVLQGADIVLDAEPEHAKYFQCAHIDIIEVNQ